MQRENSRPGTRGWEIPAGAGTVITGYASETSVAPGQTFHLHVAGPAGLALSGARVPARVVPGVGGRLIMCLPGCRSSHAVMAQPPPTKPGSVTGLSRAPWRVTDRVEIPPDAVSGYYEAKLETVGGAFAGAVGSVPLIVRQSPAAPASAVLVQVPVNTWEAYNQWGGKSLYQFGTSMHADPHVVAFVKAAFRDLTRPAPPAALIVRHRATGLIVSARLRAPDPRILRLIVRPVRGGRGCADSLRSVCRLPLPRRATRYAAVAIDQWGASQPLTVTVQPGKGGR